MNRVRKILSLVLVLALVAAFIPAFSPVRADAAGGNVFAFSGDNLASSMSQFTQSNPYTVSGTNKDQYTDTGYYTATLTEGKTYILTAKCDLPWATTHNTAGTNPGTAAVWLYLRNSSGSIISYRFFDMTGDRNVFTAPSGTGNTAQIRLQIYGDGTNTYTGHFWNIGLYSADDVGTLTVNAGTGIEGVYATGMTNLLPGASGYTERNPYVISGSGNDDYRILDVYTSANMIPGDSYTIYAKSNLPWATGHNTTGTNPNTAAVWLYFRDSGGNIVDYHFFNMTGDSATFNVPANAAGTAQLRLQAYGNGSATHTAKFWDIVLVKNDDGNIAQSDTNVLTKAYTKSSPYILTGNAKDRYEYIDSYSKYNLTPGDTYVIGAKCDAAWASTHKTDGSQPGLAAVWLVFYDTSGATVTHSFFNMNSGGVQTFTVPSGATGKCRVRVQLYSNGSTNYTVKFWDLYLYKPASAPTSIVNTASYDYPVTVGATVKTGYHWGSWSGALSSSSQTFRFRMPSSASATLTANAEPNSYTINFAGNGSTGGSTAAMTAYYDQSANLTANGFTKTGYTFDHWLCNGATYADKAPIKNLTATDGASFTFTAQWAPNTYTVAFDGNGNTGGTVPSSFTATYDTPFDMPSGVLTKTGYTFAGWTVGTDGTTVYGAGSNASNLTAANGATVTMYAKWVKNTYSVRFNGSGATSGDMDDLAMTYDEAKNLTANGFEKTGYHFLGWSRTAGAAAPDYTDRQSVSNLTAVAGVVVDLYAVWAINTYAVSFTSSGEGYTVTQSPAATVEHGGSVSFQIYLDSAHSRSDAPEVTVSSGEVSTSRDGCRITYTVSGITGAQSISVGDAAVNVYGVTFSASGVGYTVTQLPAATVSDGGSVSFFITLAAGYSDSPAPEVTATKGSVR
nr:InlB B-repeat-containing protein [Clostridia bacterium]